MRAPIDTHEHNRPFDPDAYLRVDDFVTTLTNTPNWIIEIHEIRNRATGASSHHVNDVILRARRQAD
jgi:hypothetical protein